MVRRKNNKKRVKCKVNKRLVKIDYNKEEIGRRSKKIAKIIIYRKL